TRRLIDSLRLGIESKFVVLATVLILVATVISNRLILTYWHGQLYDQTRSEATVLAESMAVSFLHALIYEELDLIEESGLLDLSIEDITARQDLSITRVEVLDSDGRIIAHSDYRLCGQVDADALSLYGRRLPATTTQLRNNSQGKVVEVATPLRIASKYWGTLVLDVSLQPADEELDAFGFRLGLLSIVGFAAAITIAFLVARTLASPIKRLAQAMSEVGPDLQSAITVDRSDEMGLLQSSFLDMLARLKTAQAEQARTQNAMAQAEKLASIGALASGVAHEINNPLGGVKNCLAQMEKHPEDERRRRQYLGLMGGAVTRIEQVVRGLLDFSRRNPLQSENVDLNNTIHSTLELVRYRLEKNGIDRELDLSSNLPALWGDRHQLEQVLVNLILNAVDSMPQGGRLDLRTRFHDRALWVHIRDTGSGIDPAIKQRIFDPFFTTKETGKGTGLGLSMGYNIVVEKHGGEILVDSKEGVGTTFTIKIPMAAE
ncbi:MAG: ATP-binding protein, partial [Candidatus Latescibacteria bacterium]|nr:ATP-binding protein [Candidatus Latescibacterota bacterium]